MAKDGEEIVSAWLSSFWKFIRKVLHELLILLKLVPHGLNPNLIVLGDVVLLDVCDR